MPSLQDQLKTILPEWEAEQSKIESAKQINQNPKATMEQVTKLHRFKPTNNASRETFNAVRDFPKQTNAFYIQMLEKKGFKATTTSSLLYQMVRQGQMHRDDKGLLTTNSNAYAPLKTAKTIKRQEMLKEPNAPVKPKSKGIAALTPVGGSEHIKEGYKFIEHEPRKAVQRSLLINHTWDAQKEVEKLSVVQARALYDLLKTIFGG